jgi:hypothetical protein
MSSNLQSKNVHIKTHNIIILSVVLYGCEQWKAYIKGEHRLRKFVNQAMNIIHGHKREETGNKEMNETAYREAS